MKQKTCNLIHSKRWPSRPVRQKKIQSAIELLGCILELRPRRKMGIRHSALQRAGDIDVEKWSIDSLYDGHRPGNSLASVRILTTLCDRRAIF